MGDWGEGEGVWFLYTRGKGRRNHIVMRVLVVGGCQGKHDGGAIDRSVMRTVDLFQGQTDKTSAITMTTK